MGSRIMKTTIEIADDLFERAHRLAQEQKTSFRALTETGLRLVLAGAAHPKHARRLPPLVTYGKRSPGKGFKNWDWNKTREEIYQGRGS